MSKSSARICGHIVMMPRRDFTKKLKKSNREKKQTNALMPLIEKRID
ncbi:hypothetical protein [Enterococcus faecalis]